MKVPLTVVDHLRRAEQVYGHRTAFIDEPDQPAEAEIIDEFRDFIENISPDDFGK